MSKKWFKTMFKRYSCTLLVLLVCHTFTHANPAFSPLSTLSNGLKFTDITEKSGQITRYIFDEQMRILTIVRSNQNGDTYLIEKKFWGKNSLNDDLLIAESVADGENRTYAYNYFEYDEYDNVLTERRYEIGPEDYSLEFTVNDEGELLNSNELSNCCVTINYPSSDRAFS
jgi:hypothetical protein